MKDELCKICLESNSEIALMDFGYNKPHLHSEDGKSMIFDFPELAAIIQEMPKQEEEFKLSDNRGYFWMKMNNEYLDSDGYPIPECLLKISEWPYEDAMGWFDFIYSVWAYSDCGWENDDTAYDEHGKKFNRFNISTCGWSGNEDIIKAMQDNAILWAFHWVESRRGGHYIFEVKK